MKIRNYWVLIFILSLIFVSGCATVPRVKVGEFPVAKLFMNNKIYYPLLEVCKYLHIDWEFDALARQVQLHKADTEVKLLIDSSIVLVNGSPLDIEEPVGIYNGAVVIPQKFKELVIDRFYCQIIPTEAQNYLTVSHIRKVAVDAGHGGHDPGAIGRTGLKEKDVNLDIAKRLGSLLSKKGINVVMTRTTDKFIPLEERAEIANRAKADFFISVHSNSARTSRLNGFEVYYMTEKVNDCIRALDAAQNADLNIEPSSFYTPSLDVKATLWDILYSQNRAESIVLAQDICQAANRHMGVKILGVKDAKFCVLRGTHMPSVLIEVGFVSHPTEEKYLRNGFYRQQIAEAISEGIFNYDRQYDLASASYK